jgi:hypothetical protein
MVVGIGTQLLFYGAHDRYSYSKPMHLPGGRYYLVNGDSVEFMQLAHHPDLILRSGSFRQSRPGYVALSALFTRLLGSPAQHLGLDRLFGQSDSAYFPLILMSATLLAAAALLLVLLLRRLGTPPIIIPALTLLLVVNHLTKLFFWTPHEQTFAFLVPLATITLAAWIMRTQPGLHRVAVVGLVVGVAALTYGSFVITAAVCSVVLLLRGRNGWRPAGILWVMFVLPQVVWIAVCKIVTGAYYSGEVNGYREFVWLRDAVGHGPGAALAAVQANAVLTARALLSTTGLLLLLLLVLVTIAIVAGIRLAPVTPDERQILIATGLTIVISSVFAFGVGVGIWRVVYHVLPPVLLLIGWISAKLVASPTLRWRATVLFVPVASAALVVREVAVRYV